MASHRSAPTTNSFLLSAGEASGDNYGAQLVESFRQLAPDINFWGLGGEKMRAAGCRLLVNASEVAVVGLAEVVTHLPGIYRRYRQIVEEAARSRPAAAVLIDFPDFNLRLARDLHRLGIPVFYFVSPQIWAWRVGRVKQIQKYVRKMIVIFPFEREFYRARGVDVSYVGHPLAYAPDPKISRAELSSQFNIDPSKPWIALLPGSRHKEVKMNLPAMLSAAKQLGNGYEYVLPVASTLQKEWLGLQLGSGPVQVKLSEDARATLKHSTAAVVASGTATVETALAGVPFVVVYRLARLTWLVGRPLVNLDTFAMPNLIAGRRIVTELIQNDCTAENIVRELQDLVSEGDRRRQMLMDLSEVRTKLNDSGNAQLPVMRAAQEILEALGRMPGDAFSGQETHLFR